MDKVVRCLMIFFLILLFLILKTHILTLFSVSVSLHSITTQLLFKARLGRKNKNSRRY